MGKTIKIIDILAGKEKTNKFKYNAGIFERENNGGYIDEDGDNLTEWILSDYSNIYDEVEIIEEDKKIEKLENEKEFYSYSKYKELKNDVDKILYILKAINLTENKISNLNNKLNEIIDKVNSLEKNQ